jgi:organic hydroperoxide reductase OsmC/OhrA
VTVATTTHKARLVWEGGEDRRAHRLELADQVLAASSAREFGGDGAKADPEEMLVAALSSCHMLWFISLAREERLRVASYEDDAEGTLDGHRFTRAILRPRVAWEGLVPDAGTVADLHHRAHDLCFISNSVNFQVEVDAA